MATSQGCRLSAALALSLALGAALTTCGGAPAPGPEACPYQTPLEWQGFLDRWAADARWAPTCEEGGCDDAFRGEVDTSVRAVFEACAPLLAERPGLAACTDRMRRFAPAWMRQHSADSYGFALDDHDYFAAQEAPGMPEGLMSPPPELVAAIPDVDRVTAVARRNGWRYLEQSSCLGASRIFVLVSDPAGRFDQWTLLNLPDYTPGAGYGGLPPVDVHRTMSFLAVQQKDAAGAALAHPRLHFRDYTLVPADGGGFVTTLDEHGNTKCYACHPSGPRRLIGRETPYLRARPVRGEVGYVEDAAATAPPAGFAASRLAELNARLASYGLPDWDGLIVVPDLGPPVGKDLGCTVCHDGRERGVLTVMTSTSQLDEKVSVELSMPPDAILQGLVARDEMQDPPLTPAEETTLRAARKAHAQLAAAVQAERGPALRDWLLETRCR